MTMPLLLEKKKKAAVFEPATVCDSGVRLVRGEGPGCVSYALYKILHSATQKQGHHNEHKLAHSLPML